MGVVRATPFLGAYDDRISLAEPVEGQLFPLSWAQAPDSLAEEPALPGGAQICEYHPGVPQLPERFPAITGTISPTF